MSFRTSFRLFIVFISEFYSVVCGRLSWNRFSLDFASGKAVKQWDDSSSRERWAWVEKTLWFISLMPRQSILLLNCKFLPTESVQSRKSRQMMSNCFGSYRVLSSKNRKSLSRKWSSAIDCRKLANWSFNAIRQWPHKLRQICINSSCCSSCQASINNSIYHLTRLLLYDLIEFSRFLCPMKMFAKRLWTATADSSFFTLKRRVGVNHVWNVTLFEFIEWWYWTMIGNQEEIFEEIMKGLFRDS